MSDNPFGPDVLTAVAAHMNGDHADDCVVICRALGGHDDTVEATMTGLDGEAVEFLATTASGPVTVRVPFSEPITERAQIREQVARMYHESAAILGLPSREH